MTKLAQIIASEIRSCGTIPFSRFMELALYCPDYGYYEKEEDSRIGRRGDYFTSVSVGSLFGELLAFQFAEWLGEPGPGPDAKSEPDAPQACFIAEAGAHGGQLANDILGWLRQNRPRLFSQLQYWILEPSKRRRRWQEQFLAQFSATVRWAGEWSHLPKSLPGRGIIFSNELLDALPVHRLGWDAARKSWFEWGVAFPGGGFEWTRLSQAQAAAPALQGPRSDSALPVPTALLPALPPQLAALLPQDFSTEICPLAQQWWTNAANLLRQGRLVTIDYGLEAEQFLAPERAAGTLRAYRAHRMSSNVLADPGEQDITAHVNFTAIQAAGEAVGLHTDCWLSQAQFLMRIAAQMIEGGETSGSWSPARKRQFKTLTHPEHLGLPFRVLVQSRAVRRDPDEL